VTGARVIAALTDFALRLLLHAYPSDIRGPFGHAIRQDVRADIEAAASRSSAAAIAVRATAGAVVDLASEWRARLLQPRARPSSTSIPVRTMFQGMDADVWLAIRRYRARPVPALIVVVTLGLAVGAATVIFSVADAALLQPLPFPHAERLVRMDEVTVRETTGGVSLPVFDLWRELPSLDALAFYERSTALVMVRNEPDRLPVATVSREFLTTLGVPPALGHGFSPGAFGPPEEVVISHYLWQRLGGHTDVIGARLAVEPSEYTVVGVMPPGFGFPADVQVWRTPPQALERIRAFRELRFVSVIGRLKDGQPLTALQAELDALTAAHPAMDRIGGEVRMAAVDLRESMVGHITRGVVTVAAAAGLLLILACCNVSAMLLAFTVSRQRELAVHAALGASQWRLVRQNVAGVLLLSIPACVLGLTVARLCRDAIVAISLDEIPRIGAMTIDSRAFGFSIGAAMLAGLAATLLPSWIAARLAGVASLRSAARDGSASPGILRVLRGLLVAQVALTFIILCGGLLLARSLSRLSVVDTGFSERNILAARLNLTGLSGRLPPPGTQIAFYADVLQRVREMPGVEAASFISRLPLSQAVVSTEVQVQGVAQTEVRAIYQTVGPGYFSTIGARVVEGRELMDADRPETPAVVINEVLARRLFEGESPLGRRVMFREMRGPVEAQVVGVIRPLRYNGLQSELAPEIYADYRVRLLPQYLVLRTIGPADALTAQLRSVVRQADPSNRVTLENVTTIEREIARRLARPRFFLALVGTFGSVALLVATAGLYGVMGFAVAQRRHEMGVRLALGASPARLFADVMGRGAMVTAIGLALGLTGAALATRGMTSLLFDVKPLDPPTFAATALLLALVAGVACWIPASRARATDPLSVLRTE
jgi:putative ABC transport system permease protein